MEATGLEGHRLSCRRRGGSLWVDRGGILIRASACLPCWCPAPNYYLLPGVNWSDKWDQPHLYAHTTHSHIELW